MSDTSFPFGDTPQHQSPAPELDPIGAGRDRRALYAVAGAAVVAVVAGGAFLLFSGGGDDAVTAAPVPHVPASSSPASASPAGAVPALYDGAVGRNPFKALVTPKPTASGATTTAPQGGAPVAGGGGSSSGGSGGTGGNGLPTSLPTFRPVSPISPVVPTAAPTVAPSTTATPTTPTTSASPAPKPTPHTITVISVDPANASATIEVDAQDYPATKPGDTFATYFQLLRIQDGTCTSMSYGDERFDLCAGQSTDLS